MNDDELRDLFSAFDEVSATDSMKSSALSFIMLSTAPAEQEGANPVAQTAPFDPLPMAAGGVSVPAATAAPAAQAARTGSAAPMHASRGSKSFKAKWRAMRVAAVAACLALALTGGAAYAYYTPVSYITITQGDVTIELPVNIFNQTLGGSGNDAGMKVLDGLSYQNLTPEESISLVSESLKRANPDEQIVVKRKTNDEESSLTMGESPALEQHGGQGIASVVIPGGIVRDNATAHQDPAAPSVAGYDYGPTETSYQDDGVGQQVAIAPTSTGVAGGNAIQTDVGGNTGTAEGDPLDPNTGNGGNDPDPGTNEVPEPGTNGDPGTGNDEPVIEPGDPVDPGADDPDPGADDPDPGADDPDPGTDEPDPGAEDPGSTEEEPEDESGEGTRPPRRDG